MECTVKGLKVNYEVCGQGEPVLLLHGWASSLQPWRPLMKLLSAKYQVIAGDFPGMGGSEEPKEPWDVDGFADFVLAFLEQFGVKKLSLVGHSYGGRIIIKLANRQLPFAIDKIVRQIKRKMNSKYDIMFNNHKKHVSKESFSHEYFNIKCPLSSTSG